MNGQAPPEKTAQRPRNTVLVVEEAAAIRVAVAESLRGSVFRFSKRQAGLKLSPYFRSKRRLMSFARTCRCLAIQTASPWPAGCERTGPASMSC